MELTEAAKYRKMWDIPAYREFSPGEHLVCEFIRTAKPKKGATILDVGCGPGRASLWLNNFGFKVIPVDLVENCLDAEVRTVLGDRFRKIDITRQKLPRADYVFCCDVMEHLPPDDVDGALRNILNACDRAFFSIALVDDEFGEKIGEPLHLTVRSFEWWRRKLDGMGHVVKARDAKTTAVFHAGRGEGLINNSRANLVSNTRKALKLDLPDLVPHEAQDTEIMIVGGGPSLDIQEIRDNAEQGIKAVAVNGSHDWLIGNGIVPGAMVVMDSRKMNARFVRNPHPDCVYLIASQCHPSVFKALEGRNVIRWHTGNEHTRDAIEKETGPVVYSDWDRHPDVGFAHPMREEDHAVPPICMISGGSTVTMRAINVMYALGYRRMKIYGMDCCYLAGAGHAYPQDENWSYDIAPVTVNGRTFIVEGWMLSQAKDFVHAAKEKFPDDLVLDIRGDGLLAHYNRYINSKEVMPDGCQ